MLELISNSGLIYGVLFAIPLVYWYFTRNFNYFTKLGIKGPRPYFFVGTLWGNFLQPNPVLELQRYQKYGKIYGIFEGNKAIVQVGDPDLIKQILVTDFHVFAGRRGIGNVRHPIMDLTLVAAKGDDWRRIRWIVSPTFTPKKMKRMYPLVRQSLATFLDTLDTYAVNKREINAKDMYGCYAMDVIANCAFATKTNSLKDPNNQFLMNARKVFSPPVWRVLIGFLLPTNALNFLNIRTLFEEKSLDFFSQTMREIIKTRKKSETKFNDFVELLMKAKERSDGNRDESDRHEDHYINEENDEKKKVLDNNLTPIKCLTEDEVLAQGFSFFAAGFETTSSTLSFCSYELALNPDVQQKLYEEVMSSVDTNGEIDYEVLTKLPFLDAVITETLRLHSTALKLTRKAAEDYRLGDTGITIPKGDIVEIPIHAIHHSEEYYPNPEMFIPDRFLPENRDKIIPYTYLPFGAGPRNCVGMRFAFMEVKACLAHIIQRFKFMRCAQTAVPLTYVKHIRSNSAKAIIIALEARN